jgi:hypothetical protein
MRELGKGACGLNMSIIIFRFLMMTSQGCVFCLYHRELGLIAGKRAGLLHVMSTNEERPY